MASPRFGGVRAAPVGRKLPESAGPCWPVPEARSPWRDGGDPGRAGYKRRIVESLDGHARSQLQLWFESVVQGAYVDASDYVKALLEVIYSISELGGVVVVGRGANFILGHERGFHIRVVAPREVRVRNLVAREGLGEHDARREVERSDHERDAWVRQVFQRSADDPLGYDLVVNHLSISMEAATSLVAAAAQEKFERLRLGGSGAPGPGAPR